MDLTEVRRANLRIWFSDKVAPEKDRSLISQLKNSSGNQPFGERVARRLEKENGMPKFYLDNPSNIVSIAGQNTITNSSISANTDNSINTYVQHPLFQDEQTSDHIHKIEYLDVRAAAGMTGFSNADYPEIIRTIYLSDQGVRELVGKNNTNGLRIINVPTDSMEPTIKKGDFVLIDTSVNVYTGEGIYAFSIDGDLFIKRLQKMIGGGYLVTSDNKDKYSPEEMSGEVYQNAKFVGKFMKCWRIEVMDL